MKHEDVLKLMEKRDKLILEDKEVFKKALLIDKITDVVVSERIVVEQKYAQRGPWEDDQRYVQLSRRVKKKVTKMLDKIDSIVEKKFGSNNKCEKTKNKGLKLSS